MIDADKKYKVQFTLTKPDDFIVLKELDLDLHYASLRKVKEDHFTIYGYLSEDQVNDERLVQYNPEKLDNLIEVFSARKKEVSDGNRLSQWGYNSEINETENIDKLENCLAENNVYMNVEEIEEALNNIGEFEDIAEVIELPEKTHDGRVCNALRLGLNKDVKRNSVYFTGSVHAREWGGSDICIHFIIQMIKAYYNEKIELQYGERIFNHANIKDILEKINIYVFPDVNPDGKWFSQNESFCWRKNRRKNSENEYIGVDLNRNFDLLWDSGIGSSDLPCSDFYRGDGAFSEPETRNVKQIFDDYPDINFYVDIHSYAESILYPWGHAKNQGDDPEMNFLNTDYEGKRKLWETMWGKYKEFMPEEDKIYFENIAESLKKTIDRDNSEYTMKQSYELSSILGIPLNPVTGTSTSYAYCRHLILENTPKIYGLTIEFGKKFVPEYDEMEKIIKQVNGAMIELCMFASELKT